MTENEKINGWTFEETIKTAENIMESEQNMFKWDVLRHLRDFAEMYEEELQRYRALGTVEELRISKEKQIPKKVIKYADGTEHCPTCDCDNSCIGYGVCIDCGQKLDWSDTD